MITIACACDGLPAHEHVVEWVTVDGVYQGRHTEDIAQVWVDWKTVARVLWADAVTP